MAAVLVSIAIKIITYKQREAKRKGNRKTIAFFHPYCDAGGGGERVLWVFIDALLTNPELNEHLHIVLYSGENKSAEEIFNNVEKKFGIIFTPAQRTENINVVQIHSRFLLEAQWYPVATMLGQSAGSMVVGLECLAHSLLSQSTVPLPDIFCDTTGAAFTYIAAKLLFNCVVIPYVHYPTISADMLAKVREMRPGYNNNEAITNSTTVSGLKLLYYQLFAFVYSLVLGSMTDVLIANGSWTEGHLRQLLVGEDGTNKLRFTSGDKIKRVFPPCNTKALLQEHENKKERELHPSDETPKTEPDYVVVSGPTVRSTDTDSTVAATGATRRSARETECVLLSIGQFRPEKDHLLQIQSFHELLRTHPGLRALPDLRLVIMGSVRNPNDEKIVRLCMDEVERLNVSRDVPESDRAEIDFANRVELKVNVPYAEIVHYVHDVASIGLHTMWNEHFGISVVEMQAAGLLTIAHASGGPKMDIITAPMYAADTIADSTTTATTSTNFNGFLASTKEEYAACMAAAVTLTLRHQYQHQYRDKNMMTAAALLDSTRNPNPNPNPTICANISYEQMLENAAASVNFRFSDETFKQHMCDIFAPFLLPVDPAAATTTTATVADATASSSVHGAVSTTPESSVSTPAAACKND